MDKKLAFQILGLSETRDEAKIRQGYLTLLKDTNPEDDPEGFKRLREAYEEALCFAGEQEEEEEQPQGEVGLWMQRVREVYRDILLRREPDRWKTLFDDPVCVGLDTFLEARGQILGFLSGHALLPQTVWRLLDQVFHVLEDFDALKDDFHVNFLKHIEYHVNTEDFLDYSLFEALDGYLPESDEEADDYIREYFQIKNQLENNETEGVSQSLSDMKRHGIYHPYEEVERLRLYIRREECEKGRELAENLIERYPADSYVRVWTGKIFYDTGDEDKGFAQWQAVLSEEPDYYMAKYFAAHCLTERKSWYQAVKYVNELVKVNRRDEELLGLQKEIDNELVPLLREALDRGEAYEDLSGKELRSFLGWRLFDLERYEDILTLLAEDSELETEEDGLELKAWALYRLERYGEAIPVYQAHLKSVQENGDDEKKRASKAAQSHRLLGVCYYCTEKPDEGERETKTAIELEQDERTRIDCKYYLADRYLYCKEYERATEVCDEILSEDEGFYPAYLVRQEACYHMRKAQQVVDDYYRAIDIYAGFDRPYLYAAMIFYDYNQYKDALGVIERARENEVEFSPKLRFQEAKILRMLSEDEESRKRPLEILNALLKETKEATENESEDRDALDRAELLFEKGLLFEGEEKLETAIELVQGAAMLDPEEPYYVLVLGNLLRDSERFDKALAQYKRVEKVYHHAEFYFGMGVCYQMAEEWRQAADYFMKAVEQDDTYRDTNLRLYRCYENLYRAEYKQADYDKAMRYINKQLEITENRGYRLWDRGNLYVSAMETALAVADYEAALAAGTVPGDECYILWENIGVAYKNDRRFEKGYEAYRHAVETMGEKGTSVKGYRGMAKCCQGMGDYERAVACCREGLAVFPADDTLWDTLDNCYRMMGRPEEALRVEEERRKQTGDTIGYYANVSYALLAMGKVQEGLALFGEMKKLWLQRAADKKELAELYREWADHLTEVCAFAEGAKKYQDAAALYGDNWRKKFQMEWRTGNCYYMIGDREKAAYYAKKALACLAERHVEPDDYRADPQDAPLHSGWLAWCDLMLGEKEKAKQVFEKMEQQRPCASCQYKKCYEASFWLGCYYYCEGEFERAAALFEETLRRDVSMTLAKCLLEKIRNGDSDLPGKAGGRMQSNDEDSGRKQGFMARLFHRTKEPMK
ncbi:MAG: tetratricopeptide repeat protein [Lachnospiraceae bacterium]|nr:tetratricopeptide repeat protein [Lachnospiraceae bacterium]